MFDTPRRNRQTGTSGQLYGIRAIEFLEDLEYEVHLILSKLAEEIIATETAYDLQTVKALADEVHDNGNPM